MRYRLVLPLVLSAPQVDFLRNQEPILVQHVGQALILTLMG